MRPLGAGTFIRCSSESPLSLVDGVWNVLKEVSQGATKIPSRTQVVLLRKRKGKSVFDWGWLQLSLVESSSQVESSWKQLKAVEIPGSTHIWSRCCLEFVSQPRLPRVTRCHRYNPAVTSTSCALAKYGASDLCPRLTNSIGSPLSPGQTCCHQVPKHLCHVAMANLVQSRNCHYACMGVRRIALRD
ncbi:hypothetical protein PIB30_054472 [Stylosanthes scabra]|uniref:Uncharacterized protein n=1 Tax=Stylosanthes scabra TaxID=79078 RepID=A0ABU6WIS9_9FABA|nr:hypothetical protein [Stylosanthes scabra]